MGAHNDLKRRKCQQSEKSTVFWQENRKIQEMRGCTQAENPCHSPTPGKDRIPVPAFRGRISRAEYPGAEYPGAEYPGSNIPGQISRA